MSAYAAARSFLRPILGLLWRLRVTGAENVPLTGPLIVACNHVSYIDPVALGVACPRPLAYMAKAELFHIALLGPLISALGAYPVERTSSATAAIKRSVQVLKSGGAVGMFPQGTRVRALGVQARTGVALLARLSGAPVIPAYVAGSSAAGRFRQIKVAFGSPLAFVTSIDGRREKATREELANWTAMIMERIATLAGSTLGD